MSHAIDAWQQKKSYHIIADKHGVSKSTLQRLFNGGVSMSAFNAAKH